MSLQIPVHRRVVIGARESLRWLHGLPLDRMLDVLAPWAGAYVGSVGPTWSADHPEPTRDPGQAGATAQEGQQS